VYRVVEAVGPDHEKRFRVEVEVNGAVMGVGEGSSRRVAETSAAAQALEALRSRRESGRSATPAGPATGVDGG
jgi:dsRNA-specific ribonuclease